MTYEEKLYELCTSADLADEEDVTVLVQTLATEILLYNDVCMRFEEKIKELMTAKDFEEWSTKMAKELFREGIEHMEDGEFKEFVLDHFDEITEVEE